MTFVQTFVELDEQELQAVINGEEVPFDFFHIGRVVVRRKPVFEDDIVEELS